MYSTISPFMPLMGTLFFILKYFIDKYNMLYVNPLEYDSNGMTMKAFIWYTIIGIAMFNVITVFNYRLLLDQLYL